jgi:c-di-GMP phosphodiesterase
MQLFGFDASRPCWRLLCAALVFTLPVSLGLWELHTNYLNTLSKQSESAASRALTLMELMLDHAEENNRNMFPLLNYPCEAALFTMRKRVVLAPFVRTTNLIADNGVYCNSLLGKVNWLDDSVGYSNGLLRLLPGNPVLPRHPVLAVRSSGEHGAVLSTIDREYIKIMLTLSAPARGEVLLNVGNSWLNHQGELMVRDPKLPALATYDLKSSRYPLSLYAGMDIPSVWRALWQVRHLTILMLLGFSLSIALLVWWLLGRPRSMEVELKRALRAREFVPYLQPLVVSGDGRVMGAEVLMRWQHPSSGLIRPDLFIPQAEECGIIVPMTQSLMQTVAQQLSPWQESLPAGFHIGFNISAVHCRDLSLLAECRAFLDHFSPGQLVLVLELTERELLVATPNTLALFKGLDEMGVLLAIDDFGTGHSSLLYLQQFHVDYLKIDQSFIRKIGTESLSEHIVDNVIDLGSRLGLALVAEGVEIQEQAEYLRRKGVDYLQGYLFGHPVPLRQFCDEQLQEEVRVQPKRA